MCLFWFKEHRRNEAFRAVSVNKNIVLHRLSIEPYVCWGTSFNDCAISLMLLLPYTICCWYARVTITQVLQYLSQFDATAMQSCKPLRCGARS